MTITQADQERIRRRYPPKRLPPLVLAVLGVLVAVLIGYVVWVASHKANPPVAAQIQAFQVVSDNEIRATLAIDRPDPAQAARCFLVSQAETYDRVGERWVEIPPGTEKLTRTEVSLRTFKRATTIEVQTCTTS